MSVIHFDSAELSNAAAFLLLGRYSNAQQQAQVIEDLCAYSVGNTLAYNRTYSEAAEPVGAVELTRATTVALRRTCDKEKAKGTLRLLGYNGISNGGTETSLLGYHEAMSRLMRLAFARVMDEQQERAGV